MGELKINKITWGRRVASKDSAVGRNRPQGQFCDRGLRCSQTVGFSAVPCTQQMIDGVSSRIGGCHDQQPSWLARVIRGPGTGTARIDEERPVPERCHLGAGRSECSHRSEQRGASRSEPRPTVSRQTDGSLWVGRGLYVKSQVNVITRYN